MFTLLCVLKDVAQALKYLVCCSLCCCLDSHLAGTDLLSSQSPPVEPDAGHCVAHQHTHDVVHGDLKRANVLLTRSTGSQGFVAKVGPLQIWTPAALLNCCFLQSPLPITPVYLRLSIRVAEIGASCICVLCVCCLRLSIAVHNHVDAC
jgi:serine/threonine protein kinase